MFRVPTALTAKVERRSGYPANIGCRGGETYMDFRGWESSKKGGRMVAITYLSQP